MGCVQLRILAGVALCAPSPRFIHRIAWATLTHPDRNACLHSPRSAGEADYQGGKGVNLLLSLRAKGNSEWLHTLFAPEGRTIS